MSNDFDRVIDALPGVAFVALADGSVDYVNQGWCSYTGRNVREAVGRGWLSAVHPDDHDELLRGWDAVFASQQPRDLHARLRRFDGTWRRFLWRVNPLDVRRQGQRTWCGIATDIEHLHTSTPPTEPGAQGLDARDIINSIPAMVSIMSSTGELEQVNGRIVNYLGSPLQALRNWASTDIVHPDDLPSVTAAWRHSVKTGLPYNVEHRIRRFDGVYRWFHVRGLPIRDHDARVTRWCVLQVDIDEHRRDKALIAKALAEVSASEDRLRDIIDAVPGFVWSAAPDGGVTFINQRWCDYTGISLSEAQGIGWTRSIHPDDAGALATYWVALLQSGDAGEFEARLRRVDGVYRWFLIRAVPQRDDAGNITRWYGENTDIEDRKQTEMLLAGEKRLLGMMAGGSPLTLILGVLCELVEATFEGCMCSIVLVDLKQPYPCVGAVPRLQPGAGPHVPTSLMPGADDRPIDPVRCPIAMAATHNTPIITGDLNAESRWSDWRATALSHGIQANWSMPVTANGIHVIGVLSMMYPTAQQPSTEQQNLIAQFTHLASIAIDRARSEEALSKVRSELAHLARVASLGAVTASIAHEVNQPLAGIITNASTCLRMLGADPPNVDGARETARRTIRDGNRAADVINRLRALFSKKTITIEEVDVNEAAREVIAMLLGELQRDGVMLQPEFADALPTVRGDRVQLQQVILNLILNATEAMTKITSRSRHLLITTGVDQDQSVYLAVRDNGSAFDPQDAERLFNAFYTTKASGMGIGLSISRSIIERHEGRLWASVNDGPGATFQFCIPQRAEGVDDDQTLEGLR